MGDTPKDWLLSTKTENQMEMIKRIVNLRWPDQLGGKLQEHGGPAFKVHAGLVKEARDATKSFWPELWERDEWTALSTLREVRDLLKAFWAAKDKRERLWYIHRAREQYQAFMLRRQGWYETIRETPPEQRASVYTHAKDQLQRRGIDLSQLPPEYPGDQAFSALAPVFRALDRETDRNREEIGEMIEDRLRELVTPSGKYEPPLTIRGLKNEILDELNDFYNSFFKKLDRPPAINKFEAALFKLQERAELPSRAPKVCSNPECPHPYFFASNKSRKVCSTTCAIENVLRSKRESKRRHKDEWRYS